ncbi:hypothetical protein [Flavivirga eckloniae]|uniref:Uncharacterized protein n=1 Tax=Flavivirga eckloniae TaxID=1803846 RepID=A0A2K9PVZ2_9FLAO|nr:hypothetical protein [Flavivirga eckloniae]AUP81224.1 hypothetical protein C1H87_21905 [Flavivirga eckloniae]
MEGIIDCYQLEVARNIPKEFTLLENNYQALKSNHRNMNKAIIGVGVMTVLFIVFKIYSYEKEKRSK